MNCERVRRMKELSNSGYEKFLIFRESTITIDGDQIRGSSSRLLM